MNLSYNPRVEKFFFFFKQHIKTPHYKEERVETKNWIKCVQYPWQTVNIHCSKRTHRLRRHQRADFGK